MHAQRANVIRGPLLALLCASLVGCATVPHDRVRGFTGAHDTEGQEIAQGLQRRYDDNALSCTKDGSPSPEAAVLCSGILIRSTQRGAGYDVWNPNPGSLQPNGVSFTWMRRDSAVKDLAWNFDNGYTLLPALEATSGYTQLIVRCAFAFDGGTAMRDSPERDGCGPMAPVHFPHYPDSGPCQPQGVTTLAAWLTKFQVVNPGDRYYDQCGFTLFPVTPDTAAMFALIPQIRAAMPEVAWEEQNEVRIGAWQQNDPLIPLEAFFYLRDTRGLIDARLNQQDFFNKTGRWVPVITVVLPTALNGAAWFVYVPFDQAIP